MTKWLFALFAMVCLDTISTYLFIASYGTTIETGRLMTWAFGIVGSTPALFLKWAMSSLLIVFIGWAYRSPYGHKLTQEILIRLAVYIYAIFYVVGLFCHIPILTIK